MRERAVTFGSHSGLSGVLSEPGDAASNDVAVLLFNVGLNHHVGPHRFNVELARQLADHGFIALRFDLAGLGDSDVRKDTRSDEARAVLDVQEAMDFVRERKSIDKFVVVGLCSGVDPAHTVAVGDARIKGAVFIDGYAYTTPEYYVREAIDRVRRLLFLANYRRWFRRRILALFDERALHRNDSEVIFDRTFPPLPQFKHDLTTMLERGVEVLFLYTRQAYFFNHLNQFPVMIGAQAVPDGVEVEHQLGADHVFTSSLERTRGLRRVVDWIDGHFGIATTAAHSTAPHPGRRSIQYAVHEVVACLRCNWP